MHCAAHFQEHRPEWLRALMRAHPLAGIVAPHGGELLVNHLPLMWVDDGSEHGVLRGHMSRKDPLSQAHLGPALAMFQGPQAYVSPNWYATKAEHGKVVPTWNYVVVHAHGTLSVHDDAAWLHAQLCQMTDAQESNQPQPWSVHDAPAEFTERLMAQLLGIELCITRLEGKWKLSQNQPLENREGVIRGLTASGQQDDPVAHAMQSLATQSR
jgi:transcriptional regulator